METERIFEEAYRTIEQKEVAVIRDVHGFPVKSGNIISPYLMLFICHSGSSRILYDMREAVFRPNEVAMILPNHLGYADSPSFCRFFKRHTGMTPKSNSNVR